MENITQDYYNQAVILLRLAQPMASRNDPWLKLQARIAELEVRVAHKQDH